VAQWLMLLASDHNAKTPVVISHPNIHPMCQGF